jgi:hypothetical protein
VQHAVTVFEESFEQISGVGRQARRRFRSVASWMMPSTRLVFTSLEVKLKGGFHKCARESFDHFGVLVAVKMIALFDGLPAEICWPIAGEVTAKNRAALKRPRIVLSTPLTREDPHFEQPRAAISRRRGRPAGNRP